MEKYPEYLYHYTSIDNLALILKNKTIRFNSLINVDDPIEIKTLDTEGIGKYCYCSCWTDQEESIPFWSMYTKDMHGVMIKMKTLPFDSHEEFLSYYADGTTVKTYIPEEIYKSNQLYSIPTIPFLRKIKYINKPQIRVFERIKQNLDGSFDTVSNMNNIGLYKSIAWSFQSEWRYSMILLPHNEYGKLNIDVSNQNKGLLQNFYDIKINDDAFNSMEITMGPRVKVGEQLIIEAICEKYAPKIKIFKSKLQIR